MSKYINGNEQVSFVVLNYKDSIRTVRLVEAIAQFSVAGAVVVVDNDSPDNSYRYIQEKTADFGNVVVVKANRNSGYAAGNNLGLKILAESYAADYGVVLNPDVDITEDAILSSLRRLRSDPRAVACAPVTLSVNRTPQEPPYWEPPTYFEALMGCLFLYRMIERRDSRKRAKTIGKLSGVIKVGALPGSLLVVDLNRFQEIGMYDEGTFLYCEEDILSKRAERHGYHLLLDLDASYIHEHGHSVNRTFTHAQAVSRLYESRKYYLKQYCAASPLQLAVFDSFAKYSAFLFRLRERLYHARDLVKRG